MTRSEYKVYDLTEPMYLKNTFEEAVIRLQKINGTVTAFVKFKGKPEFLAKQGSSVVADATLEMNVISKKDYENF